jgi:subtilisin-like proprotein convertase family protein
MRALWLLLSVAYADTLTATLGEPLTERSHEVAITVDHGVASYKVQRVFVNRGERADEASLDIDLPFGGGVTGLRIKARDTWYDGDLMEAKEAARLYEKLTGMGPFPAKDPALLQWVWPDKVHLQVFPVLPGGVSTVEYTLTVPTRYEKGRYRLSYPRYAGAGLAPPAFITRLPARFDGREVGTSFAVPPPAPEEPWDGGVERQPGGSYVFSSLLVPDVEKARGPIHKAVLDLDLSHTYRGDLRVELVTPRGQRVLIHDRTGGNANDLKQRFPLALPEGTSAVGRWRLVISDHAARDVGTLNHWTLELDRIEATQKGTLFIPDAPEGAEDRGLSTIEVAAPPIDTVAARLGRVIASAQHGFLRLDLDAAPELRPLPKQATVVFVVDASHSLGEDGIARQLAIARAYLGHVPDAEFEVVAFRRRAERLLDRFAPAARFDELVKPPPPGNGSALEAGVQAALAALEGRRGPRRVVLLTDAALRTRFAISQVPRVPDDVILHVVLPEAGSYAEERRDDDHPLSPVAASGHGILLHLTPGSDAREVVLGLVRPIRIDHFAAAGLEAGDVLREGDGVRLMKPLPQPPGRVTLTGKIWAEPFRREVVPDAAFSKATAAFVFSEHLYTDLDEREQMAVAMKGQVVSPVTSYIAVEPGTRPSRIGIVRGGNGGSGSGYGRGAGGLGGRAAAPVRPDLQALLQPGIDECRRRHGAGPISLDVETTWDEIVDVLLTQGSGALGECAVEAAWAARLPPSARSFARDRYRTTF